MANELFLESELDGGAARQRDRHRGRGPQPGVPGPQTLHVPPGRLVFVFVTARSSGVRSVAIKNTAGAAVFTATGKSGDRTMLAQGSFVSGGDGTHTLELTGGNGLLRAARSIVYQGDTSITTYVFGTGDGGVQSDRGCDELVVTLQVFRPADGAAARG